jgi:hypothetical protein
MYWVARFWFLARRGILNDDPIVFALKDPASYAAGGLAAGLMLAASFA